MKKIIPFLWYDGQLEEAMDLYLSVFKNGKIISASRYPDTEQGPGKMITATFELEGQTFYGLNGGPHFKFTEAVSFFVDCKTQEEVDELWEKLSEGGEKSRCGWLKDKFGLSWQIVPSVLGSLLNGPNPVKSQAVMQAMMQMSKLNIQALQEAYDKA